MKPRLLVSIAVFGMWLVVIGVLFGTSRAPARAATTFWRDLRVGSSGDDVLLLQQILNRDPATRIAPRGVGSPGQETKDFGALTRLAVIRFQEKYAAELLAPAGLSRGTGIVGPLTRKKLLTLRTTPPVSSVPVPGRTTPSPASTSVATVPTTSNHNLANLDLFIDSVVRVQKERNVSDEAIAAIVAQIRTDATTRGDFREEVLKKDQDAVKRRKAQVRNDDYWRDLLVSPFSVIRPFFAKKAFAAAGLPFGGNIVYIYPCTCSATALITAAGPLGAYLDYVYGTQGFPYFNLPYAAYILGDYIPGSGETCYIVIGYGCTIIPSEGLVTSVVGSTPD